MFRTSSLKRVSLKKRFKIVIKILIMLIVAFFLTLFVGYLFMPIHERGHALVCQVFGLKVFKIEWGRISFEHHSDWRINAIVHYAGGFFAAFFLSLTYIAVSHIGTWLIQKRPQRTNIINTTFLPVKTAILADIMIEFTGGILEGTNKNLYLQVAQNVTLMLIIIIIFFLISFLIQSFKLHKNSSCAAQKPVG